MPIFFHKTINFKLQMRFRSQEFGLRLKIALFGEKSHATKVPGGL
jgi:hypothetical protein